MATFKNTIINDTGYIKLPAGTTAERPGSPTVGMIRFNTSFNITEFWNGSNWINAETNNIAGLDGSTEALAAPSASAIKTLTGTSVSGDYWIKPPGQTAYKIYCDMTNQGGGWMLVGVGREGRQDSAVAGFNSWWNNAGNGDYATGLRTVNLGFSSINNAYNSGIGGISNPTNNRNPRYMPVAWIAAACGGQQWQSIEMIINRPEMGDSYYFRGAAGNTNNFNWSNFNPGGGVDSGSGGPYVISHSRYSELWLRGTLESDNTGTSWVDNDYGGANSRKRLFTRTWSGHTFSGQQYNGWSTGSKVHWPGFQGNAQATSVNGEGHALQFVNIFVR